MSVRSLHNPWVLDGRVIEVLRKHKKMEWSRVRNVNEAGLWHKDRKLWPETRTPEQCPIRAWMKRTEMKDAAQEFEDQVIGLCVWQMLRNPRTESELKEDNCYWSAQNQQAREGNKQEMGRGQWAEGQRALPWGLLRVWKWCLMEPGRKVNNTGEDSRGGGDFQNSVKKRELRTSCSLGGTGDWVPPTHSPTPPSPRDSRYAWQEQMMITCLKLRAFYYTYKSPIYQGRGFKVTMTSTLDKTLTMSLLMRGKLLMPEQIKIKVWVQIGGNVALSRNPRFCSAGSCSPGPGCLSFAFLLSFLIMVTIYLRDDSPSTEGGVQLAYKQVFKRTETEKDFTAG